MILDDAHLLQAIDPQALMILRAVFQNLQMYRARYALVITGPSGLFGEVRDIAEPVTRFFEHMPLTGFSRDDTAEAIRHPLEVAGVPLEVPEETVDWTSATPAEREVLRAVAAGAEVEPGRRGLLSRLMRKNLIHRVERGRYRLYHPLFAEFVLRQPV